MAGVLSLMTYYAFAFIGSQEAFAFMLQPQINGAMPLIFFGYLRWWFMMLVVPLICLIPDYTFKCFFALFSPQSRDVIMRLQRRNPRFNYRDSEKASQMKHIMGIMKEHKEEDSGAFALTQ